MPQSQPGNQNAKKGSKWRNAIDKALKQYETWDVKRGQALHSVALKVVDSALNGDMTAIREIGDRLDGKPAQAITGPTGEPISLVQRVIIVQADDVRPVIDGEIEQELLTNSPEV